MAIEKNETAAIPVVAEDLHAEVRRVTTGGVRVHKKVREHEEIVDQPLRQENIEVRRVMKDEVVAGPLPVRQDGDTTIVPVVKEVLKIERQWVLTEELHIVKRRNEERQQQSVTLRHEEADVRRIDAERNDQGPAEVRDFAPSTSHAPTQLLRGNAPRAVRKNKIIK